MGRRNFSERTEGILPKEKKLCYVKILAIPLPGCSKIAKSKKPSLTSPEEEYEKTQWQLCVLGCVESVDVGILVAVNYLRSY